MKTILYAASSRQPFYQRNFIGESLEKSSYRLGAEFRTLLFDGTSQDFAIQLAKQRIRPDLIVTNAGRDIHLGDARAPIFDLDWLFGHDNLGAFVCGPRERGAGKGLSFSIDSNGTFHFEDEGGWEDIKQASEWITDSLGLNGPPKGHPGDRYGSGEDTDAVIAAACFIAGHGSGTGIAGDVVCHILVEGVIAAVEGAVKAFTESMKNTEPAKLDGGVPFDAGVPTPSGSNDIDDVSGMSFLLLLREWINRQLLDETAKAIQSNKLPPEESDERIEFNAWLNRTFQAPPIPLGRINEQDETGYSFLYFLYREAKNLLIDKPNRILTWWWHHGAPIDPVEYTYNLIVGSIIRTPCLTGTVNNNGSIDFNVFS